MNNLRQLHL